jgi:hypothetical protein
MRFAHVAHKAYALARQGTDETLVLPSVTDCASGSIDTGTQCGFRNDPTVPDCSDQIVSADNPIAVLDQVLKEIEDLRSHGNQIGPATQFAAVGVKPEVSEAIAQMAVPRTKMLPTEHFSTSKVKKNKAAVRKK